MLHSGRQFQQLLKLGSLVVIDRKGLEKRSNGTYAPAVYN